MPGLVKIGLTENIPKRLKSLYTTGVPIEFEVKYSRKVHDMAFIEDSIHKFLSDYRYNKSREFFKIDLVDAIAVSSKITEDEEMKVRDRYFDKFNSIWDCPIDNEGLYS